MDLNLEQLSKECYIKYRWRR